MKNHVYQLNLSLHRIRINVSFPCTVGATLQIGTFFNNTFILRVYRRQITINIK